MERLDSEMISRRFCFRFWSWWLFILVGELGGKFDWELNKGGGKLDRSSCFGVINTSEKNGIVFNLFLRNENFQFWNF